MESQIYTTAQVAEALGVKSSTIRTWKQRKNNLLVENLHWIAQDGSTLWTESGLAALKEIKTDPAAVSQVQRSESQNETLAVVDRYEPLLNLLASAITPRLVQRLDELVMGQLKNATVQPMTASECVATLEQLGLPGCDPQALLNSSPAGLLAGGSDE